MTILLFILGAVFGSFLTAYTYRWPRGISIKGGRSKCDDCGKEIAWYDNIPIFSYLFLMGKCRYCGKKISIRYPLTELSTAFIFVAVYNFYVLCGNGVSMMNSGSVMCTWRGALGFWGFVYFLFIAFVLIAVFIIDLEFQLIPDSLVFLVFSISVILTVLFRMESFYSILFTAFTASDFFLFLHLITKGRGMGLGDVKLVLSLSSIVGWPHVLVFLFLSFVIGAIVGIVLIVFKKAAFGRQIAFGPFLILSFFITIFWGSEIAEVIIPLFI